jgi:ribonuclease HII
MLAGGVIGAIGASCLVMDKHSRQMAIKDGKKLMRHSKDVFRSMSDMF